MNVLVIGGCGYIGSAVYSDLVKQGHNVGCFDIEKRGNPGRIPHDCIDYHSVTSLAGWDTVILLAGYSSVGEAKADPAGAFLDNVVGFEQLLRTIKTERFIYASSSSVYSGFGSSAATENPPEGNMYDLSKFIGDGLAVLSGKDFYGLRFGTVNGPSLNTRHDVMLNRMVQSALDDQYVSASNLSIHRPILGIKDLVRAIRLIVNGESSPGIYNLASFNSTVGDMAATVADLLNVPLHVCTDSSAYDFTISTDKFQRQYDFVFEETIESIVADLVRVVE